jgi:integrase
MLTDTQIKRALRDVATEVTLNDGSAGKGTGSLRLRIRRNAGGVSATWLAFWKQDGQRASKTLGTYPALSLTAARDLYADQVRPVLQAGQNPRVIVAKTDQPTIHRMFEAYVDSMGAKGRVSAEEVRRVLLVGERSAAQVMGRTRMAASVTPDDVVHFVAGFYRRNYRGAADKARSYLGSAFSWAMKAANDYTREDRQDWGIKVNPVAAIPRDAGAINTRERALSADELRFVWASLDDSEISACIRLLICCGQRVQETLRIDAEEIDLVAGTWHMPKHKTKTQQRPHTIPLPGQAAPILRDLIARHPTGPLFPARKGSKSALISHRSVNQALGRWLAWPGCLVADFQTRDLRRTWKSRTHDAGVDRFTRDLIQQHAKHDTGSLNYDRADYLPQMRQAMKSWEVWLDRNVIAQRELAVA